MFIVEEQPDHFLDTAFDYSETNLTAECTRNRENCRRIGNLKCQLSGNGAVSWVTYIEPSEFRQILIKKSEPLKRNTDAGYPTRFVSSTIDNFIHKQDEANEKLIPDFLFDERKKRSIQLPFCKRNEKLSNKFTAKLNSFTDNKYSVHIFWQTRKI